MKVFNRLLHKKIKKFLAKGIKPMNKGKYLYIGKINFMYKSRWYCEGRHTQRSYVLEIWIYG